MTESWWGFSFVFLLPSLHTSSRVVKHDSSEAPQVRSQVRGPTGRVKVGEGVAAAGCPGTAQRRAQTPRRSRTLLVSSEVVAKFFDVCISASSVDLWPMR